MGKNSPTSARHQPTHRRRMRKLERNIRMQQKSVNPVIPNISFGRVVREILAKQGEFSIRARAMQALQCAAEEHVTELFNDAGRLASYQKRDTVLPSDFHFFTHIRSATSVGDSSDEEEDDGFKSAEEEGSAPPLPVPVQ